MSSTWATLAGVGLWAALAALALALHYGEQLADRRGARRSGISAPASETPPGERGEEGDAA